MNKKKVSKSEFEKFIKEYPRKLERDVYGAFIPPLITYNDFTIADKWPDSVVAFTYLDDNNDTYFIYETT